VFQGRDMPRVLRCRAYISSFRKRFYSRCYCQIYTQKADNNNDNGNNDDDDDDDDDDDNDNDNNNNNNNNNNKIRSISQSVNVESSSFVRTLARLQFGRSLAAVHLRKRHQFPRRKTVENSAADCLGRCKYNFLISGPSSPSTYAISSNPRIGSAAALRPSGTGNP
jgi:hypothetical protein